MTLTTALDGSVRRELDIHEIFAELTTRHTHFEPYVVANAGETWTTRHATDVPSLVHQLLGATPAASKAESGSGAVSRPNARIEALDTVELIDDAAGRWIERLGDTAPADTWDRNRQAPIRGSGTIARLNRLHGLHAGAPRCDRAHGRRDRETGDWCCDSHAIEHDVRRWWQQARIITGWDSPAYRPFNTCPVCDHRGGLRVNVVIGSAMCVECRSVWDPTMIGLLADHIRRENDGDQQTDDTPTSTEQLE